MKTFARLLGLAALACGLVSQAHAQYCQTNADTAGAYVTSLQRMIAESDSASLANVGLPKVAANQVQLVINNNTCKKAVAAYRTATGQASTPTSAYVVKVGTTRLVVMHPAHGAGHFRSQIVLNASNYAYIAWMEG